MKVYAVQVKRADGTTSAVYLYDSMENALSAVEDLTGQEFCGFYGEDCVWEPLANGSTVTIWFPRMNKPIKF